MVILRIPAWLVGTIGALIVAISSLFNALMILDLDQEISNTQSKILESRSKKQNSWDSHTLAENRWIAGEILQDTRRLQDAIVTMAASAGEGDPEKIFKSINEVTDSSVLSEKLDELRIKSMKHYNKIHKTQKEYEDIVDKHVSRRTFFLWLFNVINFIGVTILLCKDLPMWRQNAKVPE